MEEVEREQLHKEFERIRETCTGGPLPKAGVFQNGLVMVSRVPVSSLTEPLICGMPVSVPRTVSSIERPQIRYRQRTRRSRYLTWAAAPDLSTSLNGPQTHASPALIKPPACLLNYTASTRPARSDQPRPGILPRMAQGAIQLRLCAVHIDIASFPVHNQTRHLFQHQILTQRDRYLHRG